MHKRSPRAAVRLEPHASLGECSSRQVVDHDVGPQPRRGSVRRGVTEVDGTEVVVARRGLPQPLRLLAPYGVTGVESGSLVDRLFASRAIQRA